MSMERKEKEQIKKKKKEREREHIEIPEVSKEQDVEEVILENVKIKIRKEDNYINVSDLCKNVKINQDVFERWTETSNTRVHLKMLAKNEYMFTGIPQMDREICVVKKDDAGNVFEKKQETTLLRILVEQYNLEQNEDKKVLFLIDRDKLVTFGDWRRLPRAEIKRRKYPQYMLEVFKYKNLIEMDKDADMDIQWVHPVTCVLFVHEKVSHDCAHTISLHFIEIPLQATCFLYEYQLDLIEACKRIYRLLKLMQPCETLSINLDTKILEWKRFLIRNYYSSLYERKNKYKRDNALINEHIKYTLGKVVLDENEQLLDTFNTKRPSIYVWMCLGTMLHLQMCGLKQDTKTPFMSQEEMEKYNFDYELAHLILYWPADYINEDQLETFRNYYWKFLEHSYCYTYQYLMKKEPDKMPYVYLFSTCHMYVNIELMLDPNTLFDDAIEYVTVNEDDDDQQQSKIPIFNLKHFIQTKAEKMNNSDQLAYEIEINLYARCLMPGLRELYVVGKAGDKNKEGYLMKTAETTAYFNKRNEHALRHYQYALHRCIYQQGCIFLEEVSTLLYYHFDERGKVIEEEAVVAQCEEYYCCMVLQLFHYILMERFQWEGFYYRFVVPLEGLLRYTKEVLEYSDQYPLFVCIDLYAYRLLYKRRMYKTEKSRDIFHLIWIWIDNVELIDPLNTIEQCPWLHILIDKWLPRHCKFADVKKGLAKNIKEELKVTIENIVFANKLKMDNIVSREQFYKNLTIQKQDDFIEEKSRDVDNNPQQRSQLKRKLEMVLQGTTDEFNFAGRGNQ